MATSIARWLLDDASSGTADTSTADDTGNSNTLTIDFATADGNWTSVAAGNGLDFTTAPATASTMIAELADISANGNIGSSFSGATSLSAILRGTIDAGHAFGSRVLHIGTSTGNGDFGIIAEASKLVIRWDLESGGDGGEIQFGLPSGITTIGVSIDTTAATDALRVLVYYDGVLQTLTSVPDGIAASSALGSINSSNRSVCLGNRPSQDRNVDGKIYYAELFTGVLTPTEHLDAHTALAANNDTNWGVPVGAPDELAVVVALDAASTVSTSRGVNSVTGTFAPGEQVTLECTALDTSPATQTVTVGGEAATVDNWNSGDPIITIPLHIDLEWGVAHDIVVTDDTGSETLVGEVLAIPAGWEIAIFNGTPPDPATTESFYEYAQTDADVGNVTMAVDDELAFESATGLSVDVQTIPTVSPPSTVTGAYKIWDDSLGTWSTVSDYTINDLGFLLVPEDLTVVVDLEEAALFSSPGLFPDSWAVVTSLEAADSTDTTLSGVESLAVIVDLEAASSSAVNAVQPEDLVVAVSMGNVSTSPATTIVDIDTDRIRLTG